MYVLQPSEDCRDFSNFAELLDETLNVVEEQLGDENPGERYNEVARHSRAPRQTVGTNRIEMEMHEFGGDGPDTAKRT